VKNIKLKLVLLFVINYCLIALIIMSGRKKDSIWQHFIEKPGSFKGKTGSRAVCKTCKIEMQGLVQRLKTHHEKCAQNKTTIGTDSEGDLEITDTNRIVLQKEIVSISANVSDEPQSSTSKAESRPHKKQKKKCLAAPTTRQHYHHF
jgi:hypothetical protein